MIGRRGYRDVLGVAAIAAVLGGCLPKAGARTELPDPSAREWTRLRERLAITRSELPEHPYVEEIIVAMREPHTGKVFRARGALAVDPRHAVRMILIGPGGGTALDAWVTDERFRVVVPPISLQRRGGALAEEARGLPVGFFRWWMLHPLDGRLLAAWTRERGPLYLLRNGAETVLLREVRGGQAGPERVLAARREDGDVERLEWTGRSPTAPHAGDKARYIDGATGLELEVLVERVGDGAPAPEAFLDPDAESAPRAPDASPRPPGAEL